MFLLMSFKASFMPVPPPFPPPFYLQGIALLEKLGNCVIFEFLTMMSEALVGLCILRRRKTINLNVKCAEAAYILTTYKV